MTLAAQHNVRFPPLSWGVGGGGGGLNLQIFKKGGGGLTRPQLLEGIAGKEGVTFFRGGCNFSHKK